MYLLSNTFNPFLFSQTGRRDKWHFALLYVLTTSKSKDAYDEIFREILSLEPRINPTDVMLDFEMAVMNSIRHFLPLCQIHGCFFHFTQNIWRHIQTVGLQTAYTNDGNFALKIRLLIALAFVPVDNVIDAYAQLIETEFFSEENQSEHTGAIQNLLAYFQSTYIYRISIRNGNRQKPLYDIGIWNVYENTLAGKYNHLIISNYKNIFFTS